MTVSPDPVAPKNGRPAPNTTGTTFITIRPRRSACPPIWPAATSTSRSGPANSRACAIAASTPSVTNVNRTFPLTPDLF